MTMMKTTDILFLTEYIKNELYFAIVRQGKTLASTSDTHFFSIDEDLIYENYYGDFGPLNLGCVYKYCKMLNEKLKSNQAIVHYTSKEPRKKANAAFLLGCYGVLYLSLPPKDAVKPLVIHGQTFRPFQDASQGESSYTISLLDCLQGIAKARDLRFFNFQDFNYDEYEKWDKVHGGDLNWIVPGKFLAFIGPVDYSGYLYHPPEMYLDYFSESNVKIVIRLNKKLYDANIFRNVGINHYDLFFPDGSCPPHHIVLKFMQISEDSECGIAVHCKAGLGRTGSLIGCYLIKHYRMTAHESIAWMRICRPGSVIGHQQGWLEEIEPWLLKQGNLYRKRNFQDADKIPYHDFGIYSIAEKNHRYRPVVFAKSASPPPPLQRQIPSEMSSPVRPQASKIREGSSENYDEELFIASCDLTVKASEQIDTTQMKGCVIKNQTVRQHGSGDSGSNENISLWKKYFCCKSCFKVCEDKIWWLAVRCAKMTPNSDTNKCCVLLDMAAPYKATEKSPIEYEKLRMQQKDPAGSPRESSRIGTRLTSGAGEPRTVRPSRCNTPKLQGRRSFNSNDKIKSIDGFSSTSRTSQSQNATTLFEARNLLGRSPNRNEQKIMGLKNSLTIKPQYNINERNTTSIVKNIPSVFTSVLKESFQPQTVTNRRRLGRSPSPLAKRTVIEHTRATNTSPTDNVQSRLSKNTLQEDLARLKLSPRNGSVGAASLGARRDAPPERRAPSVRSDERPFATQGDMLNSIKIQRRLRDTLNIERHGNKLLDKNSTTSKEKASVRHINSRTSSKPGSNCDQRDKTIASITRAFSNKPRPSSPKGKRSPHPSFY